MSVKGFHFFSFAFARDLTIVPTLGSPFLERRYFDREKNLRKIGYFGVDCIKDVYEIEVTNT
jgi:hypothetical protein